MEEEEILKLKDSLLQQNKISKNELGNITMIEEKNPVSLTETQIAKIFYPEFQLIFNSHLHKIRFEKVKKLKKFQSRMLSAETIMKLRIFQPFLRKLNKIECLEKS